MIWQNPWAWLGLATLAVPVLLNQATDSKQMGPEKRLFAWSVLYLFAIFAALVADKWIGA